jgi:hypothetical protein
VTETTATNKTQTAKRAASSSTPDYGMPKFEMPKFGLPNTEMPEAFREMAEKGVAHVRDTNAKARVACEQALDLLENTYATLKGTKTTISNLSRWPGPILVPHLTTPMSCWL